MTLSGRTRVAGVIGWPVSHSRSPRLHGWWLRHYGVDGAYVPLPVRPDDLKDVLAALPKLGLAGINVTLPHKERVLELVEADALAHRIGAVNTVLVGPDGRLQGTNTDAFGFTAALQEAQPAWTGAGRLALLLGAGGAARAVAVALLDLGLDRLAVSNRTAARAEALADRLGPRAFVVPWQERHGVTPAAGLLVNTTSLGMSGQPPLEMDLAALPRDAVVADIVYTPLETPLLHQARARGNAVVDGLAMLLHQARPGFKAWFGIEPEVTAELRAHIVSDLGG